MIIITAVHSSIDLGILKWVVVRLLTHSPTTWIRLAFFINVYKEKSKDKIIKAHTHTKFTLQKKGLEKKTDLGCLQRVEDLECSRGKDLCLVVPPGTNQEWRMKIRVGRCLLKMPPRDWEGGAGKHCLERERATHPRKYWSTASRGQRQLGANSGWP